MPRRREGGYSWHGHGEGRPWPGPLCASHCALRAALAPRRHLPRQPRRRHLGAPDAILLMPRDGGRCGGVSTLGGHRRGCSCLSPSLLAPARPMQLRAPSRPQWLRIWSGPARPAPAWGYGNAVGTGRGHQGQMETGPIPAVGLLPPLCVGPQPCAVSAQSSGV